MNELFEYKDPATGYTIKQFTNNKERASKLYFSTESFTGDDRYFFYQREENGKARMYRVEYATGQQELALDENYHHFGMDYHRPCAYARKGDSVYRMDTDSGLLAEVGALPPGNCTSHLTVSKSGLVWCSYQQANKIFALVVLDPATGISEVVWQDDHRLGHCQACPGDDATVMYVHETTGDALQRIWMFDYPTRRVRPYYVEKEGDWITHEVWSADGAYLYFMRYPHHIMRGTRDGHNFKVMAESTQFLHIAPSRCGKWIAADRMTGVYKGWKNQVTLINAETGAEKVLVNTAEPNTGDEHPHPSFNRAGTVVLFNSPIEKGFCNVCAVELEQVIS
ncbi:MAG: oligogalacturonate lyase family protein [Defluviitaleaceae bacterium]|nr:oligogalacturonate lyase family protein [Defluviitaleaceae bacterium]MCL2239238.1 oligogalacturonate lyase family protein [Defluviitaleaceae bacterium]MCL2239808.1 oligogalacturonate lyase family protein [Defluviitaleaceae bacterium]